jgi:hypothetical protein
MEGFDDFITLSLFVARGFSSPSVTGSETSLGVITIGKNVSRFVMIRFGFTSIGFSSIALEMGLRREIFQYLNNVINASCSPVSGTSSFLDALSLCHGVRKLRLY